MALVYLTIHCAECGRELNRTVPLTDDQKSFARVSSGLAAGPCPNGCRSTFTDLNLNTRIQEHAIEEARSDA